MEQSTEHVDFAVENGGANGVQAVVVDVQHVFAADLALGEDCGVKGHYDVEIAVHAGKDEEGGIGATCSVVREMRGINVGERRHLSVGC